MEYGTSVSSPRCSDPAERGVGSFKGVLEGTGRVGDSQTTSSREWCLGVCVWLRSTVVACEAGGAILMLVRGVA